MIKRTAHFFTVASKTLLLSGGMNSTQCLSTNLSTAFVDNRRAGVLALCLQAHNLLGGGALAKVRA